MKIGILRSIAHNIADSLGGGCGILIGVYEMNVFGEAKKNPRGVITIDFLAAKAIQGRASRELLAAIAKYREVLPALCIQQGASIDDFKTFTACFSAHIFNRRTVVTVRDRLGRCCVDEYIGSPARHVKVTDRLGRIRTKRGAVRTLTTVPPRLV